MRDPKTTRNRLSVGLSSDEYEALRALAGQYEISMAWLGRRAIGEFLDRHQNRRRRQQAGALGPDPSEWMNEL